METSTQKATRRHGEPWALGSVLGYSSANIFDRIAVIHADPVLGPFLRGLPSFILGIFLVMRNRTLAQIHPGTATYIGRRAVLPFVLAGTLSTVGLFVYYFAIRLGGVTITIPVLETYVIWGSVIAWFFLGERVQRLMLVGVALIAIGLATLSLGQLRGQPISPTWYLAIPLALCTALTYGISGVLWRDGQLRGAHHSIAIFLQFTTSILVAVAGLVLLGRSGTLFVTRGYEVAALLASGVLSGVIGIYCMFAALRLMAVARVYAFSSLTPLVATFFAHFFLHEYLNAVMLLGVLLVSAGVALTQIYRPQTERQAS